MTWSSSKCRCKKSNSTVACSMTGKMHEATYNELTDFLKTGPIFPSFDQFQQRFSATISIDALKSIYSNERVRRTKKTLHLHQSKESAEKYWLRFKQCRDSSSERGFLMRIAADVDLCPALLARIVLEMYISQREGDENWNQEFNPENKMKDKLASELLRDPRSIPDPTLAQEIWLCVLHDQTYGPVVESLKFLFGQEKEVLLKKQLEERRIPFLDENQLRVQGYDKTPDVKLETPCVLNQSTVVNWVESKALFGDPKSHATYMKDQYLTYVNRFGKGIVIYWLGYVESVEKCRADGIFVFDHLPADLISMNVFCKE